MFANQGTVTVGDDVFWIIHQYPVECLLCLVKTALRQVYLTEQALYFKRVGITSEDLLAMRHRIVDLTRADGILYTLNTVTKRCLHHKNRSPVSRLSWSNVSEYIVQ